MSRSTVWMLSVAQERWRVGGAIPMTFHGGDKRMKLHRNNRRGFQIEWRGVLFTLRPNEHYGLFGSLAVHDEIGKVRVLDFHGNSRAKKVFPLVVHEEVAAETEKTLVHDDIPR